MFRRFLLLFTFFVHVVAVSHGQNAYHNPGYQAIMVDNPAYSGSEGDGKIRLSYLNLYPGNSYNFHSVYFSYDSYFSDLHGGAGMYISDDYQGGIVNDLSGGLSYSYFLQAGKDFFINAGLSASFYHRGFNFESAVLPDQIDPLGGISQNTSELLVSTGRTVFDAGAGLVFIAPKFFGGFSVSHLTEPDLSVSGNANESLTRKWLLNITGDFAISKERNIKLRPTGYFMFQGDFISAGTGAILETGTISVNTVLIGENSENLDLQAGFSINAGKIFFYYNYRFNIISANRMMPVSILHQTGIAFSLNNVDKRKTIKTINFPKM
jgi:type IX secretion system PorP/SprF family membrane protein